MNFEKLIAVGVILLYSLGTLGIFLGALSNRYIIKKAAHALTLAGFFLHTIGVVSIFITYSMDELAGGYFMLLLAWFIILLYVGTWLKFQLRISGLTAAPVALVLCIISVKTSSVGSIVLPEHFAGLFFILHITAVLLSAALLTFAFGAALLFIYTDNKIKKKIPIQGFSQDMPALSTLDNINRLAVIAGFPLYTLGLMSGFIWAPIFTAALANPQVLIALFIWAMYALLFYQRLALGYRGRKTAVRVVVIFIATAICLILDYTVLHHSTLLLP